MVIHNPNNLPLIDYRECRPLQGNLKDLSEKNYNKLKGVLNKRGFTAPLFLWFPDGDFGQPYIMDGHGRQRVMMKEDMQPYEVPYVKIEAKDMLDAKAQLLELTSQYQKVTQEGFDEFVVDLPEAEIIEAVSFDALPFLGEQADPDVEEDEPPALEEVAVSKLHEVYQLGKHRVMCGDALHQPDLDKLMGDTLADMVFTDPPYNVDYTGKTEEKLKIGNDKQGDEEFYQFLADSFSNIALHSKGGASIYVCHSDSEGLNFRRAFKDAGFYMAQCIIWNKNVMVMGRQDYQWKHEPILYGWKIGAGHQYYGGRKQVTVWDIERPTQSREHPTMKPIALVAKALKNNSKEDDIILDSFLGSGSTLIAADQLGRVCYGTELDPHYVDVIRKRYWKLVNNDETGWEAGTPAILSKVTGADQANASTNSTLTRDTV